MEILGIDIGGTNIKCGIVGEKGLVSETREIPTEALQGGEKIMNKVFSLIDKYPKIDRIGISSAGQIDPFEGRVIHATDNIPGWTGMEIKKIIEEKFSVRTSVENDVNAAAIGEGIYGAGKGKKSFLCLTYGTGIGGAIIENEKIYHGANFSAAEFGHIIIHGGERQCTCGSRGCYEAYASTKALVRMAKETLDSAGELNGRILMELGQKDEGIYTNIINPWLEEVMIGLTSLINIFNPNLIVLGGGIMEQPYMMNYIRKNIVKYIMPNYRTVELLSAQLGNNAGIIGASELAKRME